MQGRFFGAPFAAKGIFAGFSRQHMAGGVWLAAVHLTGTNPETVGCFYDHEDTQWETVQRGLPMEIRGTVAMVMPDIFLLAANCEIKLR